MSPMSPDRRAASTVADLMRPAAAVAGPDTRFKDLARLMDARAVDAVPVVDDAGRVLGVVTASDLLVRLAGVRIAPWENRLAQWAVVHRKVHASTAGALMTHPPVVTTPDTSIVEAGRLAARTHTHLMPVVDAAGVLVGVITRRDLVRIYLRPDDDIRHAVCAATADGGACVSVDVDAGVVKLTGTAPDLDTAHSLLDRARQVCGVVDVRNGLTIRVTTPLPARLR